MVEWPPKELYKSQTPTRQKQKLFYLQLSKETHKNENNTGATIITMFLQNSTTPFFDTSAIWRQSQIFQVNDPKETQPPPAFHCKRRNFFPILKVLVNKHPHPPLNSFRKPVKRAKLLKYSEFLLLTLIYHRNGKQLL